jgi:hypothetical protein
MKRRDLGLCWQPNQWVYCAIRDAICVDGAVRLISCCLYNIVDFNTSYIKYHYKNKTFWIQMFKQQQVIIDILLTDQPSLAMISISFTKTKKQNTHWQFNQRPLCFNGNSVTTPAKNNDSPHASHAPFLVRSWRYRSSAKSMAVERAQMSTQEWWHIVANLAKS